MNKNEYTFVSDTGLSVTMLRDAAAPYINVSGGWKVVDRMRRVGLTQYGGSEPIRMVVPILFDGYAAGISQEVNISTLERMARPAVTGNDPPTVRVLGGVPRKDITKWLIESIDYAQQGKVIWGQTTSGVTVRYRQDAIVNLIQQVQDDLVALSSGQDVGFGVGGASLANKRPTPNKPFHIKRHNETIAMISSGEYGSTRWVRDILQANGYRDGKSVPDGTNLRMP